MAEHEALEICSRAMILIGADNVISFEDGTNESQVAAALYESTLRSALTEHRWNFAVNQFQGAKLLSAPSVDYAHQYELPAPILTIDKLIPNNIKYELFAGRKVYTSYDGDLWVEGIFRVDESQFPGYFTEYLEYRLAAKFAFPITSDKGITQAMQDASKVFQKAAKAADSKQRKGVGLKNFSLIDVRG